MHRWRGKVPREDSGLCCILFWSDRFDVYTFNDGSVNISEYNLLSMENCPLF